MTDQQTWTQTALAELSALRNPDGGWGYTGGAESKTEATAICTLALSAYGADASTVTAGGAFLTQRRLADGSFALSPGVAEPTWATPLAGMALARAGGGGEAVQAAIDWLLAASVYTLTPTPPTYGYNTGLRGWPWTAEDYSFVEPTSAALVFLKQQGQGQHGRVREGVSLLMDRSLPAGGWNYGETVVLGHTLLPAVTPTAMALVALADEPSDATAGGFDWLSGQRGTITSLFSLGWASIAMNRWGALDANWIADVVTRWNACSTSRRTAMDTALCLLGLYQGEGHPFALDGGL